MKQRLDIEIVERGLADSRTKAQALIMSGDITSGTIVLSKPGQLVETGLPLTLRKRSAYVSRGGDKLASVAGQLGLDFAGKIVLDTGASTGGFTDYALQKGAAKVFCVDVGNNQLAYKLRQDPRVVVMERTDIRQAQLPEQVDIAVADVSFISILKVLDAIARWVKPGGIIVVMVKPQFEAGKAVADKFRGIINDTSIREEILAGFEREIIGHFDIHGWADSGVPGAQGNVERFYRLYKNL